jgi:hypothetical protein
MLSYFKIEPIKKNVIYKMLYLTERDEIVGYTIDYALNRGRRNSLLSYFKLYGIYYYPIYFTESFNNKSYIKSQIALYNNKFEVS